jgi:hypothetical protein
MYEGKAGIDGHRKEGMRVAVNIYGEIVLSASETFT